MSDVDLDLRSLENAVERVETAVEHVEQAVSEAASTINASIREHNSWSWTYPLFMIVAGAALVSIPGDAWHSKWRYSLQYSINIDKVTVAKKPHDCEFLSAPLGDKHCDYQRVVTIVRWGTSTDGEPVESFDDGKTWMLFVPDAGASVPKYSTVETVNITCDRKDE